MTIAVLLSLALWQGAAADLPKQQRARQLEMQADSLLQQWKAQWKRSDSIRVESMLVRMKSDSVRRLATSLKSADPILPDTPAVPVRAGIPKPDSATADVLRMEPDSGMASFYADAFHGRRTSSGEPYSKDSLTCAHRWLPFGTLLRVTNYKNGKTTIVRVNDRGPWKHGRVVDVSRAAALELDMVRSGTAPVLVELVEDEEEDD